MATSEDSGPRETGTGWEAAVIQCPVNFSEGRDTAVLEALIQAGSSVPAALLADWSADLDHHRAVFTWLGRAGAVVEAVMRAARVAVERVDLRAHQGVHPRIGVVDVAPFVPFGRTGMADCVAAARALAGRLAGELAVPVYLYEEAATRPERRALPDIRRIVGKGGSEAAPDFGPAVPHPTAGVTVVGAREPLLAFNVNLATEDLSHARRIAAAVRESGGGMRGVRALGLALPSRGLTQVSVNITRPDTVSMARVGSAIARHAADAGVAVAGTELIGMCRASDLVAALNDSLHGSNVGESQVLEAAWARHTLH